MADTTNAAKMLVGRGMRKAGDSIGSAYRSASEALAGFSDKATKFMDQFATPETPEKKAERVERNRQALQEDQDSKYNLEQTVLGIFGQDAATQEALDAEDFVRRNTKKKEAPKQRSFPNITSVRG